MKNKAIQSIFQAIRKMKLLTLLIAVIVIAAVVAALLPPLVLERVVNLLTAGKHAPLYLILGYFGLLALSGVLDSAREALLTIFGQKITHHMRSELCQKLTRLPADAFVKTEPGVTASRFVGDVDTVEDLFTSGIISMFADACQVISIFAILFVKNRGLALLLILILPLIFCFTRTVQKRMLAAEKENRVAVGKATNHVPETIRCIRTIHTLRKEHYMEEKYDQNIEESYKAIKKTNFYDAIYSPVILILNAVVIAFVMILSATGNMHIRHFFGMSVGTAVAVISYISQVFSPIESIGMEIQTIQSAAAGVHRIDEFLQQGERDMNSHQPSGMTTSEISSDVSEISAATSEISSVASGISTTTSEISSVASGISAAAIPNISLTDSPCIELKDVTFAYPEDISHLKDNSYPENMSKDGLKEAREISHDVHDKKVLDHLNLSIRKGEQLTITGRTGAGKSTIFKLLLGLYAPEQGTVKINGQDADCISDRDKRHIFGYVEQAFYTVPGTVMDQIRLFSSSISEEQAILAAKTVGLHESIQKLDHGYDTPCSSGIFSQGQWQLLAIARAIAADPEILLLDEITANLDSDTEQMVLNALKHASENRTVVSISHRLYEHIGGREFVLQPMISTQN